MHHTDRRTARRVIKSGRRIHPARMHECQVRGIAAVTAALAYHPNLTRLNLGGNPLGVDGNTTSTPPRVHAALSPALTPLFHGRPCGRGRRGGSIPSYKYERIQTSIGRLPTRSPRRHQGGSGPVGYKPDGHM
jgi:hypothetical protein